MGRKTWAYKAKSYQNNRKDVDGGLISATKAGPKELAPLRHMLRKATIVAARQSVAVKGNERHVSFRTFFFFFALDTLDSSVYNVFFIFLLFLLFFFSLSLRISW